MMINIVLFDNNAILRIATKAIEYMSKKGNLQTTNDTIWFNGLYMKFSSRIITLNAYNRVYSIEAINKYLNYILMGEEVYVTNVSQKGIYVSSVNSSTNFDSILFIEEV